MTPDDLEDGAARRAEHVWCQVCRRIQPLRREYMPTLNDHASMALICGTCHNVIATVYYFDDSTKTDRDE